MESLLSNFASPVVLSFALGVAAQLLRSDLEIPRPIYRGLSVYLLLAIGLKGGVELSKTSLDLFLAPAGVTLLLGMLTPLTAFAVLRWLGRLDMVNSAAIAAHYGSVSAVTFIAAVSYMQTLGGEPEGFMPTLVAILEVPGIVVALLIPHFGSKGNVSIAKALREVLTGSSIVLLLGGLTIGFVAGPEKFAPVSPFFVNGFQGALVLFLLELGMVTARRLRDLRRVGGFLVAFGVVVPVLHGAVAVAAGHWAGLSVGGTAVLAAMVSSGSYIAAPAAVRIALPSANPTYYLTASLGITFPFNITLGIPLYAQMAGWLAGG